MGHSGSEQLAGLAGTKAVSLSSPAYFSPANYFLGIARRAAASQAGARISLTDGGEALILPEHGIYVADIPDMAEFCLAPAANFKVSHPKKGDYERLSSVGATGYIPELLWEAGFHASQGRMVGSHSSEAEVHAYDVIRFLHWPNLTRVSQTPNTMRICALLTRQPSSLMLVSRKLAIDPREVFQVYSAACSYGIVNVVSNHVAQSDVAADIDDDDKPSVTAQSHGLMRSLLAKIGGL